MRALIGGIVHESSTFVADLGGPTVLADFEVHTETELATEFRTTNTIVGGYLAACERHGVRVVPALHARAEPGAAVDRSAYQVLEHRLLELAGAAGPVDLVLLDLHGAGTLVGGTSLDLTLLHRIRALVGPQVPVAITLDLHANLPTALPALVDVLVGFQEYPHTDMAPRAELAAELAIEMARGRIQPTIGLLNLPMVLPPSTTWSGPPAELRDLARAAEATDGTFACTVFHGYPYADTPQASTALVTVASTGALAEEVNLRIGRWLWNNRDRFRITPLTPTDAVAEALADPARLVVIGDGTDNPGCGATGDSTYLLRALLENERLDGDTRACLATVFDPAAVACAVAAGVGAEVEVALGGRHGWASGPPVRATATVRAITDGRVVQQTMRRGKTLEFGPSVRLQIGAVDVIVATRRRQVVDSEILLLHGIVPTRYKIIAVKSVNHFRAGFAARGARLMVADAPGPFTRAIETLPHTGPIAVRWPMASTARFTPPVPGGGGNRSAGVPAVPGATAIKPTGIGHARAASSLEAFYAPQDASTYLPTAHTEGPWDTRWQHGGPPAALLTRAIEHCLAGDGLQLARLTCEFLGPLARRPLRVTARLVRPGRRVQLVRATLAVDDRPVIEASAWAVQPAPADLPLDAIPVTTFAPPEQLPVTDPTEHRAWNCGFLVLQPHLVMFEVLSLVMACAGVGLVASSPVGPVVGVCSGV